MTVRRMPYFLVLIVCFSVTILMNNRLYGQSGQEPDSTYILEDEDEIIINNQLFNKFNHWISLGAGAGIYAEQKSLDYPFGVDVNLSIKKKYYFTLGYLYSGERFLTEAHGNAMQLHDIHIGYGWRKDNAWHHQYAFIGPSYVKGYQFDQIKNDDIWVAGFYTIGLYAEYQYAFKIKYDLGIGIAAYTSLSSAYQTVGLKGIIYISTAYVGRVD